MVIAVLIAMMLSVPTRASWLSDVTHINIDINRQIGTGVEAMASPTIERFEATTRQAIAQFNEVATKLLAQLTSAVAEWINKFDAIVTSAIASVDQVITAAISRADEVLEVRLGNLDTIVTKANATFQSTVTQLLILAAVLVFFTAIAIVAYRYLLSTTSRQWPAFFRATAATSALLLIGAATAYVTAPRNPTGQVRSDHERAFHTSLRAMDFREARYHAAQLRILDPGNAMYSWYQHKAVLISDALSRPALYTTAMGRSELEARLAEHEAVAHADPDWLMVAAILIRQAGTSRSEEYVAAQLEAKALEIAGAQGECSLCPIGVEYLWSYLVNPVKDDWRTKDMLSGGRYGLSRTVRDLRKIADDAAARASGPSEASGERSTPPIALLGLLSFERATRQLYQKAVGNYALLSFAIFKARSSPTETAQWLAVRTQLAKRVVESCDAFESSLKKDDQAMKTSTVSLSTFLFNDAFCERAALYAGSPSTSGVLPPVPVQPGGSARRSRWLDMWMGDGKAAYTNAADFRNVLGVQEEQRFANMQNDVLAFENAANSLDVLANQPTVAAAGQTWVTAAARLGTFICATDDQLSTPQKLSVLLAGPAAETLRYLDCADAEHESRPFSEVISNIIVSSLNPQHVAKFHADMEPAYAAARNVRTFLYYTKPQ
jgi:hypothetical protein